LLLPALFAGAHCIGRFLQRCDGGAHSWGLGHHWFFHTDYVAPGGAAVMVRGPAKTNHGCAR
jgi:hypothetical protein